MITEIMKAERRTLESLLDGLATVFSDPTLALQGLAANAPVCLLVDPAIKPATPESVECDFDAWLIHPATDEHVCREFFGNALSQLRGLPFTTADPELFTAPTRNYFAYRLTYTNTYKLGE